MLSHGAVIDADIAIHQPPPSVMQNWRSAAAAPPGTDFLGLRFHTEAMGGVMNSIGARPASSSFAYVVTPNVDHVVRLYNMRSDLWPAYRHAWLTLCDSRILGRLAVRAGVTLPTVPGSDLTEALLRNVIARDDKVAILGGSDDAVGDLCRRYGLENVTHYNPPMGFIEDEAEITRAENFLRDAHARYTILAVGSPQQEIMAYRLEKHGGATGIGLCVGASLDFLTGRQTRAPKIMQKLSLEWLHRLASSPGRMWRRYLVDGPLILTIYRSWRARLLA